MELLLTYSWDEGGRADVRVELSADHCVGELAAALARFAGQGTHQGLLLRRTGAMIDPDLTVHAAGLMSGDDLCLIRVSPRCANQPRTETAALVSLDIMGGPDAGRFVLLGPGLYPLGTHPTSGIRIDDSLLAREHAVVRVHPDGQTAIAPGDPENIVVVNSAAVNDAVRVSAVDIVRIGASSFAVRPVLASLPDTRDVLGQVPFHRTPYRPIVIAERDLGELGPVPKQGTQRRFTLATLVLPLVSGVAMAALTHRPEFLLLTGLAPIAMAYNWWDDRRHGRHSFVKATVEFHRATAEYVIRAREAVADEEAERRRAAPDLPELHRRAHYRTRFLWERDRDASDLLTVRVGLGTLPSKVKVAVDDRGESLLHDEAQAALAGVDTARDVPVTLSLAQLGAVAVWGDQDRSERLLASLLLQSVCLHSPDDVVVLGAMAPSRRTTLGWVKWAPHTCSSSSPISGAHLVDERERAEDLLARVIEVLLRRRQAPSGLAKGPWLVVALDERLNLDAALVAQLLDLLDGGDASVIWLGDNEHRVPRQCKAVVDVSVQATDRVWFTDPQRAAVAVTVELANPQGARRAALSLAPVRDASAASVTASLPRTISLLDVLEVDALDPSAITHLWARSDGDGLRAPLGQGTNGPFIIDLVRQGPHTLIAGTSGAGKSELLQTMVCSLAANYSPDRVTFLFVDYKGGASSADFANLPHTVGSVTNLGVGLARRALTSLQAELNRRMAIMEGRAKDLAEFTRSFPDEAPPRLVIVVDEFATLVKELPDFVAGVVDIAQRGRSLGIHLVLATQRPAGAVNENILANTNLRLGLRMLDPADSVSVLGSPEAADIPVPLVGRALGRTGRRELTAFQTAWCGAPLPTMKNERRPVEVRDFDLAAAIPTVPSVGEHSAATQLHALVAAAAEAHRLSCRPDPRRPWIDPLPDLVVMALDPNDPVSTADPGRVITLGLVDRPDRQTQEPAAVDLEETGGLIVVGMGGAGKTTLLRSAALDAARQGPASDVVICGLDAAGRGLSVLRELPHTALIASTDDLESVTRLLSFLQTELVQRRALLADANVDSLTTLRRIHPGATPPRILLLVDGYGSFQAMCDTPELFALVQGLQRIITEGRALGVHTVMSVDRRLSIPGALASAMGARIVLRMADNESLVDCGVMGTVAKQVDLSIAGRAVFGRSDLMQVSVAGSDDPTVQTTAIKEFGRALAGGTAAMAPAPLPMWCAAASSTTRWHVALGLQDLVELPFVLDLSVSNLVVSGPPGSGRTTAATTVAGGLAASGVCCVVLVTNDDVHVPGVTAMSAAGPLPGLVFALNEVLKQSPAREPLMALVLDDADRLDDPELASVLERVVRDDRVRLVCAVESRAISGGYQPGWIGELRRVRRQLLLQPSSSADIAAVTGVRHSLRPGVAFPPGRGALVTERSATLLQVATLLTGQE